MGLQVLYLWGAGKIKIREIIIKDKLFLQTD